MDWLEIASYGLADAKGIVPVVSSASDSAVASAAKCGDVVVNSFTTPDRVLMSRHSTDMCASIQRLAGSRAQSWCKKQGGPSPRIVSA